MTFPTRFLLLGAMSFILASPAFAQGEGWPDPSHPGKAIYDRSCASCHDKATDLRTPSLRALAAMPVDSIRDALTIGKMKPMTEGLNGYDLGSLVGFLISGQTASVDPKWTDKLLCDPGDRSVRIDEAPVFAGFGGPDLTGGRMLSAAQAGLNRADMTKLEVAYVLGAPTQRMGTGIAILGDTGFINMGGKLVALSVIKGCARWVYEASSRNTPAIGKVDGEAVLAFSVGRDIHLVDARTGALKWKASGQPLRGAGGTIRGGVIFFRDKIIVPISASGVGGGGAECCAGHGAVVALAAKDGARLWEYHTMPEATDNGRINSLGARQRGPSGAPIWSVPIADEKRNRIIVTTGENTSHPATDTSDAVIALDADTGKMVWQFQAMAMDVWNMHCTATKAGSGPNCPWLMADDPGLGRDFDFGAGAVLAKGKSGKDVILAGQKSGDVWALDAETGAKLWNQRIGPGTTLGGIHWGIAIDGTRVFAAVNDVKDPTAPADHPNLRPGLYAFDISSGEKLWGYETKADCDGARGKFANLCTDAFGFSAAPIVVDGAVIAGTLDGKLFVFDGATGAILKQFDFLGPIKTSNDIDGRGGAIDSHAISAGHGVVFISSGYGVFEQTPGNVLIALKPAP